MMPEKIMAYPFLLLTSGNICTYNHFTVNLPGICINDYCLKLTGQFYRNFSFTHCCGARDDDQMFIVHVNHTGYKQSIG